VDLLKTNVYRQVAGLLGKNNVIQMQANSTSMPPKQKSKLLGGKPWPHPLLGLRWTASLKQVFIEG